MKQMVDLEELGFDVYLLKIPTHEHRFQCTIRRWDQNRENFKQFTMEWITSNGIKFIKPSSRIKKFFKQSYGDIERITGLKINWEKYDHEI